MNPYLFSFCVFLLCLGTTWLGALCWGMAKVESHPGNKFLCWLPFLMWLGVVGIVYFFKGR